MPLVKAKSDVKQRQKQQRDKELFVSDEAQYRLAEILSDAPSIIKFAGTEWEIRPLRMGTQYLIANEICKLHKLEHANYDDAIQGLEASIPATAKMITLVLLNDKNKIFQNGDQNQGYSRLFKKTYDTVLWNAERNEMGDPFGECVSLLDVSFFMEALVIFQSLQQEITRKKRTRIKIPGQK